MYAICEVKCKFHRKKITLKLHDLVTRKKVPISKLLISGKVCQEVDISLTVGYPQYFLFQCDITCLVYQNGEQKRIRGVMEYILLGNKSEETFSSNKWPKRTEINVQINGA